MIILGTNSIKDTGFNVDNSCRFNGDAYVHKAVSAGNQRTFTYSFWTKRSTLNNYDTFIGYAGTAGGGGGTARGELIFVGDGDDTLRVGFNPSASSWSNYTMNTGVFRDPSAWYNIVLKVNTTSGTEAERLKIFVNGVSQGLSGYPGQNFDTGFNVNNSVYHIGRSASGTGNFIKGYLAEAVFIDGTALDADSFGEFDDSGIWKPIDVSGLTFGTHGFYLDFEASGNLGNDANGGTDLTESGLAATDQSTDTCTNNFATLNSLINFNSGVFTEGNLAITSGDDTVSTIGLTSGRWYWEAQRTNTTNEAHIGIGVSKGFFSATSVVSSGDRIYVRGGATFVSAVSNLGILTFASNSGTPATISNGDVIGFYLDLESSTKNITVKKNDGATPIIDIDLTYSGEEPIFPFCRMNSGCASSWNFGNPIASLSSANADANGFGSFEFNPTKGGVDYFAICTKNLAEYGG